MKMAESESKKLRVIVCRPLERAEVLEIDDDLDSMKEVVGGMIEEYMPFYDEHDPRVEDVAIVCDDEGKLKHSQLNRAIRDNDGNIQDVIAGSFFICYAPIESENFESLPKDLEDRFMKEFEYPEMILRNEQGIDALKYDPGENHEQNRDAR